MTDERPGRPSGLRPAGGARREAQLELAVSLAATLARDGMNRGCRVTLVAFAPRLLRVEVSPEHRDLGVLLEELAYLRPPSQSRPRTLEDLREHLAHGDLVGAAVVVISLGARPGRPGEADAALVRRADNHVRLGDVSAPDFFSFFRRNPLPDEPADEEPETEAALQEAGVP